MSGIEFHPISDATYIYIYMISIKNSPLYNDQMLFMFIYFLMIIIKNSPLYNDQMLFMFIYFLMIYNNIVFFWGGGWGEGNTQWGTI